MLGSDAGDWATRLAGSNINPQTLLATDYLNHFNEFIMMLSLVPDMPELLDECRAWAPRSYVEHFEASPIADRDLAIAAYPHAPGAVRTAFEEAVMQLNFIAVQTVERLDRIRESGGEESEATFRQRIDNSVEAMRRLVDVTGSIINGTAKSMNQEEIDHLLGR